MTSMKLDQARCDSNLPNPQPSRFATSCYVSAPHLTRMRQVSQRLEKRDQGFPISRGQIKAETMSFDSANFHIGSFEACRYVVITQTPHVKPIFQSGYRTIVLKWASIPHPLE